MKHILYIFAVVAMLFATACSKDDAHSGQGAVSFQLSSNIVRTNGDDLLDALKDKLAFRIYSVANKGLDNEQETLVRLYTYDEIIGDGSNPMKLWLLAGDYRVKVEGGEKSEASFTDIYYRGQTDFTVAESMNDQQIEVMCRPANAMIKVVFDSSVAANMGSTAKVVVAIADEFDPVAVAANAVPNLTYKSTSTGFFMPEEDAEKFVWKFTGTVAAKDNAEVVKMGDYVPAGGLKAGYMYTLNFKYSPDLGGYLTLNVEVDDEPEAVGSTAIFKPEPQFDATAQVADGYDNIVGEVAQMYSGKKVGYNIKAISDITELKISIEGQSPLTYTSSQVMQAQPVVAASTRNEEPAYIAEYKDRQNGVTIRVVNSREWNLLLESAFSQKLGAGEQEYIITVTDDALAMAEYVQKYIGEGVVLKNLNRWMGYADIDVYINNPVAEQVKVRYNRDGGDWLDVDAVRPLSGGNVWSAKIPINGVQSSYEYYLSYEGMGESDSPNLTFSTENGPQIPNGGLEVWTVADSDALLPYSGSSGQWWDTGNHGSATLKKNVTTNSTDVHSESSGQYSAYLQSQFVSFMGIGKFASGNIFMGTYLGTDGTDGMIGFGKPYTFTYRPKKLRVWYKGKVGICDYAGGGKSKGDSDKAQIYVWLCNWNGQHTVNTKDSSTFINPETTKSTAEGNVIGYGVWSREIIDGFDDGGEKPWTVLEIPITYREGDGFSGVIPNYLVISCAASAYGDYFAGSTSSVMYVDDFEFVY